MKTVILLTTRFLKFIDLERIKKNIPASEFILILDSVEAANLSMAAKAFFDRCYEVPSIKCKEEDPLPGLSKDEVEKVIRKEISNKALKDIHLVCLDEVNLILAAQLREIFNLEGSREKDIQPFRDKLLMKKILSQHEISVPKYVEFDKNRPLKEYYQELIQDLGKKFILKPRGHAASFGVHIIDNYKQFKNSVNGIQHIDVLYEAETLVEGELYHCETIVKKGKIKFVVSGQYSIPCLEFLHGKNLLDIPLLEEDPLYIKIVNFNAQCLKALNAREGVYHLELFKNLKGELVFLEVAARAPGTLLIPLYEMMYGVNLAEQDFYLQCGLDLSVKKELKVYGFGNTVPTLKEGKVIECIEPNISSDYKIQWKVKKGDVLGKRHSLADHACLMMVWNKDYSVLKKDFELLKHYQPLVME